MIHPEVDAEQNLMKLIINRRCPAPKLELFFFSGLVIAIANIIPSLSASQTDIRAVSDSSRDWHMMYMCSTSFILSVPLSLEFCFDSVVGRLYPAYDRNLIEHKTGHFVLLFSLAAPLVLVIAAMTTDDESVFNPLFEQCFIDGCQCLSLVAIYGTLQVCDKRHWKGDNSSFVVALFFGSQIALNFAIEPDTSSRDCHLDVPVAAVSLSLLVLSLIGHLMASWRFVDSTDWTSDPDRFTTSILVTLITILLFVRTVLTILALAHSDGFNVPTVTAVTLLTNVIFALIAIALPGRMIRRGMVALKQEMESKKTFIRYISHEIRSPLSTTALGLDYLIDQMSTARRPLTRETILEVVRDARVSCELATNTLNDLLMFDKIETRMLELSTVECDAWEFVTSCVKPFQLQALCAGVAIHTTQMVPPVEPLSGLDMDLEAQMLPDHHEDITEYEECIGETSKKHRRDGNRRGNRLCVVQVDRYKMEQVLRNFLTNALKFTPQQSNGCIAVNTTVLPSFTVDTLSVKGEASTSPTQSSSTKDKYSPFIRRAAVEEGHEAVLRVEVVDNGPGIIAENLPKLFGQYVQFDANTLQGGKGSGLGLWLSKAIVEMHGGVIGASSLGAGQGCTFYFELPCRAMPSTPHLADFTIGVDTSTAGVAFIGATEQTAWDEMPLSRPEPTVTQTFSKKLPPNFIVPPPVLIPCHPPLHHQPTVQQGVDSFKSSHHIHQGTSNSAAVYRSSVLPNPKSHVGSRDSKFRSLLSDSSDSISSDSIRMSEAEDVFSHHSQSPVSFSSLRSKGSLRSTTGRQAYNPSDAQQVLVGLRVLLVDDSALARKMVERSLLSAECVVHHAQNGLVGVHKVQQSLLPGETPYDVVVVDCYMPVMNGPEAVTIMRGPDCGFKGVIFAVTGASTNEEFTVGGAPGLGVDCVMVKPFSMETFRRTVFELRPAVTSERSFHQQNTTVHVG